jgi:hypothetical protein
LDQFGLFEMKVMSEKTWFASVRVMTSPGCRTCPRQAELTFTPALIEISSPGYTFNVPSEAIARLTVMLPNETGAALTGLSVRPATAIVATAIDEATRKEPALLRSLPVMEFLNIRILSKDVRTNMEETEPDLKLLTVF